MPFGNEWDNDNDDFDPDEDRGNGGGGPAELRKALKSAQRKIKEQAEQISELTSTVRSHSIADVVKEKGYNPKIAAFVPSDLTDAEAIAGWLTDNADVFAPVTPLADPATENSQDNSEDLNTGSGEQAAVLEALSKIQAAQTAGTPLAGDPASIAARINATTSEKELVALLSQLS